jgi:hypothetical protein
MGKTENIFLLVFGFQIPFELLLANSTIKECVIIWRNAQTAKIPMPYPQWSSPIPEMSC